MSYYIADNKSGLVQWEWHLMSAGLRLSCRIPDFKIILTRILDMLRCTNKNFWYGTSSSCRTKLHLWTSIAEHFVNTWLTGSPVLWDISLISEFCSDKRVLNTNKFIINEITLKCSEVLVNQSIPVHYIIIKQILDKTLWYHPCNSYQYVCILYQYI